MTGTIFNTADIVSVPDKWEFPWFAAWDLAFHCVALARIDPDYAKSQLVLLGREWYQHPNGQIPAYEWAFGDVNPPVQAWAAWRVYEIQQKHYGVSDLAFLERVFHKLLMNFIWWVNRKDIEGHNIFQGGFLGLDNIGVFDRGAPLPDGGRLEQSDGTAWMGMFSLNMLTIALELALHDRAYEDIATKFFEHFLYIAGAMNNIAGEGITLWDEQDEFFYDVLQNSRGEGRQIRLRSLVGLIPLFAVTTIEPAVLDALPEFKKHLEWFLETSPSPGRLVLALARAGKGRQTAAGDPARAPHEGCAAPHAGRERVSLALWRPRALTLLCRAPLCLRHGRSAACGAVLAGGIARGIVRRQLQLAWPDLVSGELPDHRVTAAVPLLLRRRLQDRVPDRLGAIPDPLADRR